MNTQKIFIVSQVPIIGAQAWSSFASLKVPTRDCGLKKNNHIADDNREKLGTREKWFDVDSR